ncbi:MAG: hypothetical protein ABJA98_19215 [Acidobacteriota bacterium]
MSVTKPKTADAKSESSSAEQFERTATRRLEAISVDTLPKLALLTRWSEAESMANRCGMNIQLEQLAWRGAEMLCLDILRDLEGLLRATGTGSSFATLRDDDGGDR